MFPNTTKFLVVDHFPNMRKMVKSVLTEAGYRGVEEANSGDTALPLLHKALHDKKPIQCIISEWNMPGMTGIELLKACKSDPLLRDISFVLVTADSDQKSILEAAKAGVTDYIVKPFNAATLKDKLERVYNKTSAKTLPQAA